LSSGCGERSDRFAIWYRQQREANPDQDWPLHQPAGDWDEAYQTFHDPDAPESPGAEETP
jgi:hypothetical protein